jgi:hypothetical protein
VCKELSRDKPDVIDTLCAGGELKHRRVSELTGSEPPYPTHAKPRGYYGGDYSAIPELSPDSPPAELWSPPADESGTDYFVPGPRPRRRGAIHHPSHAANVTDDHARSTADLRPQGHDELDEEQASLEPEVDKRCMRLDLSDPQGKSKAHIAGQH